MKCPLKRKSFYGRQWVFKKVLHCLNSGSRNVAVLGAPGSGKTAICCEIAWPTARSSTSSQHQLHSRLLACHFCNPMDLTSLSAKAFVRSVVHQLVNSPLLPDYANRVADNDLLSRINDGRGDFDVDAAFEEFVIAPLAVLPNPPSAQSSHLFVMIDSLHDDCRYPDNTKVVGEESSKPSRTIYDLVCRFSPRMPSWLTILFTAGRQCRCLAQRLSGLKRIALDDMRRSNVLADLKLYVSRRLNTMSLSSVMKPQPDTWSLLHNLHTKSDGCVLYLELVLDALADGFLPEHELPSVPVGLNAFYLWLCQRLFRDDQFHNAVKPILSTLIASRKPMKLKTLYYCVWTHDMTLRWPDFIRLIKKYSRILWVDKSMCVLFHNSFATWLQNIKLSTKDYFCSRFVGHCCIAMWYSVNGARLSVEDTLEFLSHMKSINSALKLESCCLALWIQQCGSRMENQATFAAQCADADCESLPVDMALALNLVDDVTETANPEPEPSNEQSDEDSAQCHACILKSASSGCVRCTERLLLHREVAKEWDECHDDSPLLVAAKFGHRNVCKLLIDAGFQPTRTNNEGWNAIRLAALNGHRDVIELLLQNGASADSCAEDGRTALRAAAWGGHDECCVLLLHHGADPNAQDSEGRTPIFAACYMGHKAAVQVLLQAGADVNHRDCDGRDALTVTVMCCANSARHEEIVSLLLASGSNTDSQDNSQRTALHYAAREGHADMCKVLLEHQADVDHMDSSGLSPLLAAASFGHCDVVQLLLQYHACLDSIDGSGRTALLLAAANGTYPLIKLLLDKGMDELHKDNNGWIALHHAAFEGHTDVVQVLCTQNKNTVNEVDTEGRSALHLAVSEGHLEVAKVLVGYGADVNGASLDGRPMLFLAAMNENRPMCEFLVEHGVDTAATDLEGRSVLHCLVAEKRNEMVKLMLDRGFCPDCSDANGRSPLHIACWVDNYEMVETLIAHEAVVDATDYDHRTPLMIAVWLGFTDLTRLLLRHGADPNARCSEGATALSIASQTGNLDMVKMLTEEGANPAMVDNYGRTSAAIAQLCNHNDVLAYFQTLHDSRTLSGTTLTGMSNNSDSKTSGYQSAGSNCATEPAFSPYQPRSQLLYGSTAGKPLVRSDRASNDSTDSVVDDDLDSADGLFPLDLPAPVPRSPLNSLHANACSIDSKCSRRPYGSGSLFFRLRTSSDLHCSMSLDRGNEVATHFCFRRRNQIVTNPNFRRKVL